MKKKIILMIFLFVLLCGQASAAEPVLPTELERAAPQAARLLGEDAENGFGFASGIAALWNEALSGMKKHLGSGLRCVMHLVAGVLILGVVEGMAGGGTIPRRTNLVGALYITAISAGDINNLMGMGRETIGSISAFSKTLIPTLSAACAASGGITSASVRQVAAVFFTDVLLTLMDRLLIPLLYLYIASAAANTVLDSGALEVVASMLKKVIGWAIGSLLAAYTAYLSISGAVAGAADAQAVRAVKAAVSTVVPLVGSVLSEAAGSIMAGAGVLRAMLGVFGMLSVFAICLLPFLRLGLQYLLYQAAVFVSRIAGPKKLAGMLSMFADAFALMLAMVGAAALLLIISLVSAMTVVMG